MQESYIKYKKKKKTPEINASYLSATHLKKLFEKRNLQEDTIMMNNVGLKRIP